MPMGDPLTAALAEPAHPVDDAAWRGTLHEVGATLAGLAVRRAGARTFRVTDHEVRVALGRPDQKDEERPFEWTARTARRALGLAAVRGLVAGEVRTPADGVRRRLADSVRWVREGYPGVSPLDRWVNGLGPAGRAVVAAESVTWATRLWCALDWSALGALGTVPVIGRDHWWDSPHSALLALRGRADVRTDRAHLVVLSGPRRASVRSELALVTLVDALRAHGAAPPAAVVGWWPDSGHLVRIEPHPGVLTLGCEAIAVVLAGGAAPASRSAA
jgi:hypothetical protein